MELEDRLRLSVHASHQELAARKVAQGGGELLERDTQACAHGNGDLGQVSRAQEEFARLDRKVLEDLLSEVVEDDRRRGDRLPIAGARYCAPVLQKQYHARRPTLGAGIQVLQVVLGQTDMARLGDTLALLRQQPQFAPADDLDSAAGAQRCESRRWLAATENEYATAIRQFSQRGAHYVVYDAVRPDVLVVVENEKRRTDGIESAEEGAGERFDISEVLGLIRGQRARVLTCRLCKVEEEGRNVGVTTIGLIPQARYRPARGVISDQRGLSGTGRTDNPDDWRNVGPVERLEQSRPGKSGTQRGTRKLRELNATVHR